MNKSTNRRTKRRNKRKTTKKTHKKNRKTRFRNKKSIGGMKTYTAEGDIIEDPKTLLDGKDFFRKMTPTRAYNKGEKEICEILMKHPHKNIIKIYDVTNDYIDMELLNTDLMKVSMSKLQKDMMEVKTFLQGLGIMYIDWKLDNIGISDDGELKLFDFDVSGLINTETNEWKIKPPEFWAYNDAVEHGMKTPIEIDNYAFKEGLR
jgi:serine/threonine protein kinase